MKADESAIVGALRAPANAQHFPHTKQLELGAVTVILHMYPDRIPHTKDSDELIRRQVAALREFADTFEASLSIPINTGGAA